MTRRQAPALSLALVAALVLMALIYAGSRGLRDFDSALIGYAVGTVFALSGVVYRYTLWVSRPPTGRYFRAGWRDFLSLRNFRRYTLLIPKAWWTDILAQTFILRRGLTRWLGHMAVFWGVVLSCAITFPLTFGWIRFTYTHPDRYEPWVFGVRLGSFPLETVLAWVTFHALDFTAILLLAGLALMLWRRTTDAGLLAIQRFGFDLFPLVLLFAIAVTGLALTGSSLWWEGRYYGFISLTHQVTVVGWLLLLPFGKFFHIVERPATIGITLYQTVSQDIPQHADEQATAACIRCSTPLPSARFIADLRATLGDLGQRYDLGSDHGVLQQYCPACKRALRGQAYYQLAGKRFV